DQLAVIGHRIMVGMRPIGTPNDALGRMLGERTRERHRVGVRIFLLGDAIAARQLHPYIAAVEKPAQRRKRRAVEPFGNVYAADMVDDDGRIDRSNEIVVLAHPLAAKMHRDMPAVW